MIVQNATERGYLQVGALSIAAQRLLSLVFGLHGLSDSHAAPLALALKTQAQNALFCALYQD
jgi:hypothetical protein